MAGSYDVWEQVNNSYGGNYTNQSAYLTINSAGPSAPSVSFTLSPGSMLTSPTDLTVTDTSSNTPTSWRYDLANDTGYHLISTVYKSIFNMSAGMGGNYTLNASATNAGGTGFSNWTQIIVKNPIPTARFSQSSLNWTNATTGLSFTDSSTITNTTSPWYFWDTENNNHANTSLSQNPSFAGGTFACNAADIAYSDYCQYSLSHQVNDSPGTVWNQSSAFWNLTPWITSYANTSPSASYTANTYSGTRPLAVTLTGVQAGAIKIDVWNWSVTWGANVSNLQNPTFTFGQAGTYSVRLEATNWTLGNASIVKTGYITVSNPLQPPVASFTIDKTVGTINYDVTVTDTSTNSPTSFYSEIRNSTGYTISQGASVAKLNVTFADLYTLNHSATNAAGTGWSNLTTVIGYNPAPVARFSQTALNWTNTTTTLPQTDTSTGTNVSWWYWAWQNGNRAYNNSLSQNPSPRFPCNSQEIAYSDYCLFEQDRLVNDSPGTVWNVTSAYWNQTNWFTIYQNGTPTVSYSASQYVGTPGTTITFTAVPAGAIHIDSWAWVFGDGGTATTQSPSHQYTTTGQETISLTATNWSLGQTVVSKTNYLDIENAPVANFTQSAYKEYLDQTVNLVDDSTGSGLTTRTWNFTLTNHGPPYQENQTSTSLTKGWPGWGIYTIYLYLQSPFGSSTTGKTIWVLNKTPAASFTCSPLTGTVPLFVTCDASGTAGNVSWYNMSWGGSEGYTNQVGSSLTHTYNSAGLYSLTLNASNADEFSTLTKSNYITTGTGVSATASVSPVMGNTSTSFQYSGSNSTSTVLDTWNWTFSDSPTTFYYAQTITHSYAAAGVYNGTLLVTNGTFGSYTTYPPKVTVYANATPTISFTAVPLSGTAPLNVAFTGTGGTDILVDAWNWSFGDGHVSSNQNPSNSYSIPGAYDVNLTAINRSLGVAVLIKTAYITVTTSPPTAAFTLNRSVGTQPLAIQFTDTSSGSPNAWNWSFGDGGTSTAQSPIYTYTTAGSYNVSLTVLNAGGSSVAYFSPVIISNPAPTAGFTNSPMIPLSSALSVTDGSTGTNITVWYYFFNENGAGAGNSSSSQNPTYQFANLGYHEIDLIVTDSAGSIFNISSAWYNVTQAVYVKNNTPVAGQSCAPVTGTAPPLTVTCNDTSTGPEIYFNWTQGWGANVSSSQNVTFKYGAAGTFTINHTVCNGENYRDSGNCSYSYPTIFIGTVTNGGYYLAANAPQPVDPAVPVIAVAGIAVVVGWRKKHYQGKG